MVLIEHHIKYKEIHGVDETVFIPMSEHKKLHFRLRKEGKCNISPEKLHKISQRACNRTEKHKKWLRQWSKNPEHREYDATYKRHKSITFSENIGWNVDLREHIMVYPSGVVNVSSYFHPNNGYKLIEVNL